MKTVLRKNFLLIILLGLIISLIFVMSIFASGSEISYQQYFAEERSLVNTPTLDCDSTWISYPIIASNQNIPKLLQKYPQSSETLQVGSVYQERIVSGSNMLVTIAEGNYDYCAVSGSTMYLSDGGELSIWDLNTEESKVIFSTTGNIKNIWAYDEIVFFQTEGAIYRYHIDSETTDLVFENSNLKSFRPWSNQTIHYSISNPDYAIAVAASGVAEYEKVLDPSAFSNWLNQYFDLDTNPNSKPFLECDVASILSVCGIQPTISYFYNIESDEILTDYTIAEESGISEINLSDFLISNIATQTIAPYGVTNPNTQYSTNQFFSDSKYNPCTCHNGNCSYVDSGCDCKVFDGGIQCEGYARYLFYQTSGSHYGSGVNSTASLPAPTTPASTTFFPTIHLPAILRTTTIYGTPHTILIYYADDTTIKICEANTSRDSTLSNNNCRVYNFQSLTYYQFANRYQSYNELITANHKWNDLSWESNATTHWTVCPCGMQMSSPTPHTVGSDGYCTVCGKAAALNRSIINYRDSENRLLY